MIIVSFYVIYSYLLSHKMALVSEYSVADQVRSNTKQVDQSVKWSERNLHVNVITITRLALCSGEPLVGTMHVLDLGTKV